jgi:predicted CXXCH cytochrome family protein
LRTALLLPLAGVFLVLFAPGHAAAAGIDCLQCHGDLAQGKSVHPAVSMGCEACHTAVDARDIPHRITNKIAHGLSADQPELCYGCHDRSMFEKKVVHPALGMGCTSCHNPHASKNAKLLKDEPPVLCYGCHDKGPFSGKRVHPPVAAGECTTCHTPHSSDNPSLLDKPVNELCGMCHDDKSSGKHILTGYGLGDRHPTSGRPDPSRPGMMLSCVSCHTPHSSGGKYLFTEAAGKSGNLCLLCHKKISVRP